MRRVVILGFVIALLAAASGLRAQDSAEQPIKEKEHGSLKIKLTSVLVDDQEKALKFYTEILGFVKKEDIPLGEFKWLTVVSADDPDGTELLLEPNANEAAKTFQKAIFEQGIPATCFFVDDVQKEYERLKKLGVKFTMEPTDVETTIVAVFDDTCGNLIQIAQG